MSILRGWLRYDTKVPGALMNLAFASHSISFFSDGTTVMTLSSLQGVKVADIPVMEKQRGEPCSARARQLYMEHTYLELILRVLLGN
jgi:hypothetical protein